ncbi:hypothetical protein E2C01_008011 [Portunus trituberculatus]|uniref:Uncharacterized protein n=1 Tax=Portunus trituberculatus TaxID=210409 RepID=A0A5B7D1N0_PORTR|nr:hypothetical protein [Portunus trituberculatus]
MTRKDCVSPGRMTPDKRVLVVTSRKQPFCKLETFCIGMGSPAPSSTGACTRPPTAPLMRASTPKQHPDNTQTTYLKHTQH